MNEIFGPKVLHAARLAAAEQHSIDPAQLGPWIVRARLDRTRSTVACLEAKGPQRPIVAYAKREGNDTEADSGLLVRRRQRLRYGFQTLQTLSPALTKIGVQVPIPLALDEDFFTTVALEVRGRPLGRTFSNLYRPPGPSAIAARFERLGRAFRLLDDQGLDQNEMKPSDSPAGQLARLYEGLEPHLPASEMTKFEEISAEGGGLLGELGANAKLVPVHQDPSSTNVLVSPDGIGLIDFSWSFAFPGFDLYYLQYRLSLHRPRFRPWSESLARRLLDGYGPVDRERRGLLHLAELQRRARPVITTSGSEKALDELRAAMRSAEDWLNP